MLQSDHNAPTEFQTDFYDTQRFQTVYALLCLEELIIWSGRFNRFLWFAIWSFQELDKNTHH